MQDIIKLSTVTPVYHGEETLADLVKALDDFRNQLIDMNAPLQLVESIFVDDGSIDNSLQVLRDLSKKYSWIHVITLSRNFGQHPATVAGILYTSGDWVATLDEDLQHHPKHLAELVRKAIDGSSDIVYARPLGGVHESRSRDLTSRSYKWLLSKLSGNKFMQMFNSFRLMRGSIARAASAVANDQTYFDIALSWFTTRIVSLDLTMKDMRYIKSGRSGYNFWSLLSHARRLLQSSNLKFLRLGALTGVVVMVLGFIGIIITLVMKIWFPEVITEKGWASIVIIMLLLGGLNAFLIGMVLENLSIVLLQSHGKPKFFEVDRTRDTILIEWFKKEKVFSHDRPVTSNQPLV